MTRIFGFEAEFGSNVLRLAENLHRRGLSGGGGLHGYHCDCEDCDYGSSWMFRAQRDSSCGGEIISQPFNVDYLSDALDAFQFLQEAAVDSDATITRSAGFHVHVSDGHTFGHRRLWPGRRAILKAWLPFEAWLQHDVAPGPLAEYRGFNYSMRTLVRDRLWSHYDQPDDDGAALALLAEAMRSAMDADRHSTINMTFPVDEHRVEFRIWNATRAAWRMEMYVRLSLLFTDSAFIREVGEWTAHALRDADSINAWFNDTAILDVGRDEALPIIGRHDDRLGELLDRHLVWADRTPRPRDVVDDVIDVVSHESDWMGTWEPDECDDEYDDQVDAGSYAFEVMDADNDLASADEFEFRPISGTVWRFREPGSPGF